MGFNFLKARATSRRQFRQVAQNFHKITWFLNIVYFGVHNDEHGAITIFLRFCF